MISVLEYDSLDQTSYQQISEWQCIIYFDRNFVSSPNLTLTQLLTNTPEIETGLTEHVPVGYNNGIAMTY